MAQQERPEPAPCTVEIDDHVPARPAQIAHRLLLGARDPDGDELPGAVQASKPPAVPPVGLHPVAGCLRDQRWRHHMTRDLEALEEPLQLIAGRACLVASDEPAGLAHPGDESSDRLLVVEDPLHVQ
jgi:hypothetical protein